MADVGDADVTGDRPDRHASSELVSIPGFSFPVRCSAGVQRRAREVARRCSGAYQLLADALGLEPEVTLEVLAGHDWHNPSLPYGMPYYAYAARQLVVAGESADFWRSFVPLLAQAPPSMHSAVVEVYGEDPDLRPFFDLLAMHELGHAFHRPGTVAFWLEETFANVCLHTCVAAGDPGVLPVLETFPRALISLDPAGFTHRSLSEFEALYSTMDPLNYGWFQCHFHVVAKLVHDDAGVGGLQRLGRRLASPGGLVLSEDQLAGALSWGLDVELARALVAWAQ
jgi:hypothetical protein